MYERSAIVLERYFNNILGYFSENNLKVNFENYCSLVEKLDRFQTCYEQEQAAIQEFEDVTDRLKTIQKTQEKLYKKSAKLEYNRNILFNNIEDKTEDIERCLTKIENDIEKNGENFKNLRIDFIHTLNTYNKKNTILTKSKKAKKDSENVYQVILEMAQENADNINEFVLEFARNFNGVEIKEKLLKLMIDNGKEEKIPFDEEVIHLATDLGMDIAQKEVQCYIDAYDSIYKLLDEIDNGDVKIEKFKRKVKNIRVKLNFLVAQKQYLIQFLDYERMMSINSKRVHKKLMEQACENFKLDIIQINNLYELILKEIANKSSQKVYEELYNKSYLLEINKEEETLRKEKNKVNSAVATVLGSNYWRIEGIKNIYTVFYRDVSEVFGRYLDEFDVPDEEEQEMECLEESKVNIIKPKIQVAESVKAIEELNEEELPQLISEDETEMEDIVHTIPDATEILQVVKEERHSKVNIVEKVKKETKVEFVEPVTEKKVANIENKAEVIETVKEKKKRKDIIKAEEEEKKKEKAKIKEEEKEKRREKNKIEIIEPIEDKKEEKIEVVEEVKPKRRRKDIIKEEEEQKKSKAKIKEDIKKKKKPEIQVIKKTEEADEENESEGIETFEETLLENKNSHIANTVTESSYGEDEQTYEIEEESLFGKVKDTRGSRRNNLDLEMLEQLEEKNKSNKKGILSSLMNMNSKKGKRVAN